MTGLFVWISPTALSRTYFIYGSEGSGGGGGYNNHCVHPSRQGSLVATSLKRYLYLVPINQGNNVHVDVQHALRFDIEHSIASFNGYEIF